MRSFTSIPRGPLSIIAATSVVLITPTSPLLVHASVLLSRNHASHDELFHYSQISLPSPLNNYHRTTSSSTNTTHTTMDANLQSKPWSSLSAEEKIERNYEEYLKYNDRPANRHRYLKDNDRPRNVVPKHKSKPRNERTTSNDVKLSSNSRFDDYDYDYDDRRIGNKQRLGKRTRDTKVKDHLHELSLSHRLLMQDILIHANLWDDDPKILSADYAFEGILGIPPPFDERTSRKAGASVSFVVCSDGTIQPITRAASKIEIKKAFGRGSEYGDGLPVVFSWPVLPSTVQRTDFECVLNTGRVVIPDGVSIYPNADYNERNTVVLVSPEFGNRKLPEEEGAVWVTQVRIVGDCNPLMLVGPKGPVSGVGLTWENESHPYLSGPKLIASKLTILNTKGDNGPPAFFSINNNDGRSIYGSAAQYRLRVLTNWGISGDGAHFIRPDQFEDFFWIKAILPDGQTVQLTRSGYDYTLNDHTLTILGLAELGLSNDEDRWDECYIDDRDNQIDIILKGDRIAMSYLTEVHLPSGVTGGRYKPLYNPGGPGIDPDPYTPYTAPSGYSTVPVTMAINDAMVVSYENIKTFNEILNENDCQGGNEKAKFGKNVRG